jgi:hypothetical protein
MKGQAREAQIEIDATPEEVFDLIHDYNRRLEWDPFLKEARLLGTSQAAAGAVCRCVGAQQLWWSSHGGCLCQFR